MSLTTVCMPSALSYIKLRSPSSLTIIILFQIDHIIPVQVLFKIGSFHCLIYTFKIIYTYKLLLLLLLLLLLNNNLYCIVKKTEAKMG